MGDENSDYLDALEAQNKIQRNKITDLQGAVSSSSFGTQDRANLVEYQLSSDEILERIEHFLKGDEIKIDKDGNVYYASPKNEDLVILNVYGVNSVMQILGNYVNKNTNLSYYDEERINEILGDFGDEIADFIFCNYERMGLTTEFKKSRYKLLVLNILHIIESAYRRAIMGKEREGINDNRISISQSDSGMGSISRPNANVKKKFNPFRPTTW